MKSYLFHIKNRLKSPQSLFLIFAWHVLLIKKIFKLDFRVASEVKVTENESKKITIDVVIPTIPKDIELLEKVIESVRANVVHEIKNIYIVSPDSPELAGICARQNCTPIPETSVLGYGTEKIRGWIFQQLLKLGATNFVTEKYFLVIDSDTVLLNPHSFVEINKRTNKETLNFFQSNEWHKPYFTHFKKLFGYKAPSHLSHISHMMIFEVETLNQMKKEIETKHGMKWDDAIIKTLNKDEAQGFSEYETYSNWMIQNFPDRILEKPFYNTGFHKEDLAQLPELQKKYRKRYNSISFHSYLSE